MNRHCPGLGGKFVCALSACLILLGGTTGFAATLSDRGSTAVIDFNSSAGMSQWMVDGVNQLRQQWFWFRLAGDSREQSINTIGAATIFQPDAQNVRAVYTDSLNRFSLTLNYSLLGATWGEGRSDVTETITINNLTGSDLSFHFFQYSDFNLLNDPLGDSVTLNMPGGPYFQAMQTKGSIGISETITAPSANHGEAGEAGTILGRLQDLSLTTLNDVSSYNGPGDAAWAFQWDFTIGAGASETVFKDKLLTLPVIPEPSSLALIALGAAALAWRRKA